VIKPSKPIRTLPAAVIAYFFHGTVKEVLPFILALSAASFIYIAIAGLVPDLHRQTGIRSAIKQLVLMLTGIATISLFHLAHQCSSKEAMNILLSQHRQRPGYLFR
jgi:zinc and cadmium transporter